MKRLPHDVWTRIQSFRTLLAQTYPVFAVEPVPLALGTRQALVAAGHEDAAVCEFLRWWCGSLAYHRAVAAGGPRYALDGSVAGEVSESERIGGLSVVRRSAARAAAEAQAEAAGVSMRDLGLAVIDGWRERFPEVFRPSPVPLALSVHDELAAAGVPEADIHSGLSLWTRGVGYLRAMTEGAPRFTLSGEESGVVGKTASKKAAVLLARIMAKKAERKASRAATAASPAEGVAAGASEKAAA